MGKAICNLRGVAYIRSVLKSPSFSSLSAFAGSNILVSILSGIGGLLQARWLDPSTFGEFQQYGILAGYIGIGVIFVNDGLIRQYPYYLGKGDRGKALEVAGVAKWWYLFVSCVMSLIMASCMVVAMSRGNWRAVIGWGAWVVISWMSIYGTFLGIMYRTSSDFKRLSLNSLCSATWSFVALVLVRLFGYCGLALRMVSVSIFNLYLNSKYLPVKIKAIRDFKRFKELATISLKFALPAYFHSTGLTATMNALTLYFCSKHGLGVFAVALSFQGLALTFSNSLNQIFNIKVITRFGSSEDIRDCFRYALKPAVLGMLLSLCVAAVGFVLIGPFIRLAIPKYVASIPVIQVLLFGIITASLNLPLLVIKASMMWKTAAVQAIFNFVVTISLIVLLPKSPVWVAVAMVCGGLTEALIGYMALWLLVFRKRN